MSLYYEAAAVLANPQAVGGSLKSRIFKHKDLKSSPGQIFALIAETSKWSAVLKEVIEKCGLLAEEKKVGLWLEKPLHTLQQLTLVQLTPILAVLLTHDLLLAKGGVAAPTTHVLRLAVARHRARLGAELTKARLRHGHATLDAFRDAVNNGELDHEDKDIPRRRHPRWVRVNTIKTTLHEQLSTTFAGFERTEELSDVLYAPSKAKVYFEDPNIPNLLAVPLRIDLSKSPAYTSGHIILQDKASCFPAYLLDPQPQDGQIIDATAAPGNKTTHLAAIVSSQNGQAQDQKVIAFERDKGRTLTLQKMVKLASADNFVHIRGSSDFLAAKPESHEFANVGAILLDPSCSGTGIVGRDDTLQMHLPEAQARQVAPQKSGKGKKRKRGDDASNLEDSTAIVHVDIDDFTPEETPLTGKLSERLTALSSFQLHVLTHAMRFPNAQKITYSTCSIHFEENEGVVFQALASSTAIERGWKILERKDQVEGLRKWHRRGVWEGSKVNCFVDEATKSDVLESCIRCDKETEEGTMGFFVAGFIRESGHPQSAERIFDDEEWNGFSDNHGPQGSEFSNGLVEKSSKRRKKENRKRSKKRTR